EAVRILDLALRGPRPSAGISGLDDHFTAREKEGKPKGCLAAWQRIREKLEPIDGLLAKPLSLAEFAVALSTAAQALAGERAWRGPDGRLAAELLAELQASEAARGLTIAAEEAAPLLRQLLEGRAVRPPYGGHPRIFIWGLLEARLQRADLVVLGGLNE